MKRVIRRTSMKVRNPKDAPDDQEKAMLEAYAQKEAAGEELKPVIQEIDPHTIGFYAPIRVNEFCLQCHGKVGETLSERESCSHQRTVVRKMKRLGIQLVTCGGCGAFSLRNKTRNELLVTIRSVHSKLVVFFDTDLTDLRS
jgi:hypothetical protein